MTGMPQSFVPSSPAEGANAGPQTTVETERLTPRQAHEALYRFVAEYYDQERTRPILRLLEAISSPNSCSERSGSEIAPETWMTWIGCVKQTLCGSRLPDVPPPWDG